MLTNSNDTKRKTGSQREGIIPTMLGELRQYCQVAAIEESGEPNELVSDVAGKWLGSPLFACA